MNSVIAKKTFVVCTVLFLLLSGNVLATPTPTLTLTLTPMPMPMPNFTLPSVVDGKDISSEDFKGKILLVTFFATWCPPCLQEIPSLIRLQDDLSPNGFSVLGLSLDDGGPEIVNELVESAKINYPVLMANSDIVNGFGGVKGIPTSFLVSHEGKMIQTYTGYVSHELLRQDIEKIISKKPKRAKLTRRFQVKKKAETKKKDVKTKKSVIHIDRRLRTVYSSD